MIASLSAGEVICAMARLLNKSAEATIETLKAEMLKNENRIVECGLTRDFPIARPDHHVTNAVHPGGVPARRVAERGLENEKSLGLDRSGALHVSKVATILARCNS